MCYFWTQKFKSSYMWHNNNRFEQADEWTWAQDGTSLRDRLDDIADERADIPVRANPKLFHSNDNLHLQNRIAD